MDEQVEALPATLDTLFPNKDLLARVKSFVDAVSQIDGVSKLIFRRFVDGTERFYAIWNSTNANHARVADVWGESFNGYERNRADLLVVQYSQEEFERSSKDHHFESMILWQRQQEAT